MKRKILAFNLLLLSGVSTQAIAQEAEGKQDSQVARPGIEEIVVTATRRSANLQDVPVAITALTSSTLDNAGVATMTQITELTPSLVMSKNTVALSPILRGVGTTAGGPGNESSIAVYIDGVYQPDLGASSFDLLKVERVEVLRGPQGTLFGRNATGGLINIITPDPSFTPAMDLTFRYGSYNERMVRAYATTPLTENIAINVSGLYSAHDGYVDDIIDGGKVGERRVLAARGKILFDLADDFQAIVTGSIVDSNDPGQVVAQPLNSNTQGRAIDPTVIIPDKPRQYAGDVAKAYGKDHSVSLEITKGLGTVRLESTSAYSYHNSYLTRDSESTRAPGFAPISNEFSRTYQQELRLLSDNDSPLQWIAGLYGFDSKSSIEPLQITETFRLEPRLRTKSWAAFVDATFALSDQFKIGAGIRYTDEKRSVTQVMNGTEVYSEKDSFTNWSPRALVQYFPTPDINIYASYSRGFKSGVFNGQSFQQTAVKPEINEAFEVGLKAEPTTWLRVNLAAYHYNYSDLQIAIRLPDNPSTVLTNAGAARMQGIEGEFSASPVEGLQLRASVAMQDAKYTRLENVLVQVPIYIDGLPAGNTAKVYDASGTPILRAPKFTGSFGATYEHDIGLGTLGISANVYHSSYVRHTYDGRLGQKAYETVSGEIYIETLDNMRFSLWADNLTNQDVLESIITISAGDIVQYNPPRRVGVAVQFKF
ncbi:TonB-dependent receptor [Novosphingobium indicum]|uniref:TonB-dependent receptor n=1 Tax=Novosphingobium indicum TaxID=462949 RepID=A0ABQ2JZ31_9SPHN|nr:TonB-dependent receptor [Novosphingobium indicum]GGN61662.1 TonB-dependent receptor [Novosphingobium indicum]